MQYVSCVSQIESLTVTLSSVSVSRRKLPNMRSTNRSLEVNQEHEKVYVIRRWQITKHTQTHTHVVFAAYRYWLSTIPWFKEQLSEMREWDMHVQSWQ